ncbi:MAG: hypothetical protein LBH43_11025 [Treponema sp.]|jgi:hypothetical protein|nr:hypothetical protein [Treponema sp.]
MLNVEKVLGKKNSTTFEELKSVENSTYSTVVEKSLPSKNSTIQQNQGLEIW